MLNKIQILKNSVDVGKCILLADFLMPSKEFLDKISHLSDNEKLISIYENISGKIVDNTVKNRILSIENLFDILCLDEDIFVCDLTLNNSLSFNDLIIDNTSLNYEIYSYISLYYLVYLNLYENYFSESESVNFVLPFSNKIACISALIFKKMVKGLNFVIAGDTSNNFICEKSFYKPRFEANEFFEYLNEFFEDYGYVFDAYSSSEVFAYERFIEDYEDTSNTVFFSFLSPYLTCQKTLKQLTGKSSKDYKDAIKKLSLETALEIPSEIYNLKDVKTNIESDMSFEVYLKILNETL